MNNILVLGGSGQLGKCIKEYYDSYTDRIYEVYFPTHQELDCLNFEQLRDYVINNSIGYIINCAAYTNVDKAENFREQTKVNVNTIFELVKLLKAYFYLKLIQISSDYVEGDIKGSLPLNYYGETKLMAEQGLVFDINPNQYRIIRISGLFSRYGHNFIKTVLSKINDRCLLKVTGRIKTNLTYGPDLVNFIMQVMTTFSRPTSVPIIYEFSNPGTFSWYQIANFIATILNSTDSVVRDDAYESVAVRPKSTKFYDLDDTLSEFNLDALPNGLTRVYELVTELTK